MAPTKSRRLALLGFTAAGKTSLLNQFVHAEFLDDYSPTIADSFQRTLRVYNRDFRLELLDSGGQDEHGLIHTCYTMNTDGYILVYSITSRRSFEVCRRVYEMLRQATGKPFMPLVLVGNKTDLEAEREVSVEEGEALAETMKAVFIETSAKTCTNVLDIFVAIVKETEKSMGNLIEPSGCVVS